MVYEFPRQLELLDTLNPNAIPFLLLEEQVLRARIARVRAVMKNAHMPAFWRVPDAIATAHEAVVALVDAVSALGERIGRPWLVAIAQKLLFWFGPEAEIKALWGSFEEYQETFHVR